jgi:hypothetical protein
MLIIVATTVLDWTRIDSGMCADDCCYCSAREFSC